MEHNNLNFEQQQYQVELSLAEYANKKKIDTDAAVDKETQISKIKLNNEYGRIYLQEQRKEMARARYETVTILSDGRIEFAVKNTFIPIEKREVTNFRFMSIFRLQNENGENSLLEINCQIETRNVSMILDSAKAGRPEYLLKKFTEAGLQIRIAKKQDKINFLNCLWAEILNSFFDVKFVPTHWGWIKYDKGYIFVKEGELVWKELKKKAK